MLVHLTVNIVQCYHHAIFERTLGLRKLGNLGESFINDRASNAIFPMRFVCCCTEAQRIMERRDCCYKSILNRWLSAIYTPGYEIFQSLSIKLFKWLLLPRNSYVIPSLSCHQYLHLLSFWNSVLPASIYLIFSNFSGIQLNCSKFYTCIDI